MSVYNIGLQVTWKEIQSEIQISSENMLKVSRMKPICSEQTDTDAVAFTVAAACLHGTDKI